MSRRQLHAVALCVLGVGGGVATSTATDARGAVLPPAVLAEVRYEGGLCATGGICMSRVVVFQDGRVRGPDRRAVRLTPARLRALRGAIAAIDMRDVRDHPFTGVCPSAYDGTEAIYRFRGPTPVLRSCTYDLGRVTAVRLLERFLTR